MKTYVEPTNPLRGLWDDAWCYWVHGVIRRAWRRAPEHPRTLVCPICGQRW